MVIVYNPPTGAPIKGFNFGGKIVESHDVKEMKQYEPEMAQVLVATYPFMQIVTPQEAETIKEEVEKEVVTGEFKCDKCDYSSDKKIGLMGHMRGHAKEPEVVSDIPVADVKTATVKGEEQATEIPDDLKGTDWYGDGVKEENG